MEGFINCSNHSAIIPMTELEQNYTKLSAAWEGHHKNILTMYTVCAYIVMTCIQNTL